MAISISPTLSQDSTNSFAMISPANSCGSSGGSRIRRSPQFRKRKDSSISVNVVAVLRVVVLAFSLVFMLVCVLQSQHLVIHGDGPHVADHGGVHPTSQKRDWKVTTSVSGSFDATVFQSKLAQWRHHTNRLVRHPSLSTLLRQQQPQQPSHSKASPTSRLLQSDNNSTLHPPDDHLYIPFWDQQAIFRKRNAWHLMVVLLADDCLQSTSYPTLSTLQDAIQTHHADIVVYFPQPPQSVLFPQNNTHQQHCEATLQAHIEKEYASNLQSGQLQLLQGINNPLPPRVAYDYHHKLPQALKQLESLKTSGNYEEARERIQRKLQSVQVQMEVDYSLGLDFAYLAELVYQYGDLVLFLRAGTTFHTQHASGADYGRTIVQEYENFQQRSDKDHLVHRFCYLSLLAEDAITRLPTGNETAKDLPPRHQASLTIPTGIVMEQHGLYRWSMVLRSLLPYRKATTSGLLMQYCDELLWEAQVLQPVSKEVLSNSNDTTLEETSFPPALFQVEASNNSTTSVPEIASELVQKQLQVIQQQQQSSSQLSIPPWVTVDNRQLGPQRTTSPADLIQLPRKTETETTTNNNTTATQEKKLVTFVVPTSTRPNGIKNQYVTYSLNQLFPLIRRDFKRDGQLQATVLLVVCGNTQDELDDHQAGLWDYYGPELKEGILEIVATNLQTYPSLHELPNNYNDPENRLRWRSKQNLDISSSFFAAKGKSDYIMLLEDDTGYRDKFTPTLKALIESDQRQEGMLVPRDTGFGPFEDDYRQHIFAQVHFGFGYSGVLIHDDDALVYAVLHYVLMDEKPCDLLYLANYLQGQVLDQKWRWQLKRVLLTHLGSVSSLKGKFQPVWGLKG